jgi:membrane protease YdiL (CAAX protease family)
MQPEEMPVAETVIIPAAPARDPFWGWVDLGMVIGLLVAMMVVVFIAAAVAMLVPWLKANPAPLFLPVQVAFYVAIYLAFLIVFRLRYDKPVWASLGWRLTVPKRALIYYAVGGLLLSPAIALIATALHTPEVHMDAVDQLEKYPLILALFGVMAVTVAPLFEELLFRGFFQPLLSRSLGVVAGILITALLFGLLHSNQYKFVWQYVAAISVVGAVLGTVRYRTGSIIPSTVMHAGFNLIASTEIFFHHK